MTGMTSRQRVLAALNHQEPDRMPIDIGGLISFTCWHETVQARVMEYLGLPESEQIVNSTFSRTVRPDPLIRARYEVDCFGLGSKAADPWHMEMHAEDDGSSWFVDEWQIKWRKPAEGFYFDSVLPPLRGATVSDIARYRWPDPTHPSRLAGVVEQAKDLYANSDYCICFTPAWGTGIFQIAGILQGFEDHFVNLLVAKPVSRALFDGLAEFHLAQWKCILDSIGDYIQVGVLSDDLGFQDRPIIHMDLFRDMVKPYYVRIVDYIKSRKPDLKLVFHCDGAIYPFLSEFIDIGLDATNPVQVNCKGMQDTAKLKQEFGDKLSFWGAGVDTQHTLPFGTPEDVRAEARRRISDLAPGGGYVFAPVHNVQPGVRPENVVACYETAMAYRDYPIRAR
jgi:uroporphyrinogen decarboxylase